MKAITLLLVLFSLNATAGIVKGSEPTLRTVTDCTQYIFNINQLVEANKLTLLKANIRTKGCKAAISRYDAKLNNTKQELIITIKALINE